MNLEHGKKPLDMCGIEVISRMFRPGFATSTCQVSRFLAMTPQSNDLAGLRRHQGNCLLHIGNTYHLVITNSLPWKIHPFLIGKPSISMGHLYHGYVSHNQRVYSLSYEQNGHVNSFPVYKRNKQNMK
jgi:hypothetical protein